MRSRVLLAVVGVLGALALVGVLAGTRRDVPPRSTVPLPAPRTYAPDTPAPSPRPTAAAAPAATATPAPTPVAALASEVNLAIPFTSQAPHANWGVPYKEFCEEASVLMAAAYVKGETIPTPDVADRRLREIQAFELRRFGYYEDTTAEETAVILREHFGLEHVAVVGDPTAETIKQALAAGRAVIVPAAGRELPNPYFRNPGPLYHMLVIKGYTADGRFITNDPGTRRGADFLYRPDALLRAVHDWNGGDVTNGRKVMLVVG